MHQLAMLQVPRHAMMERAARHVMALGYEPSDCLLQLQRGTNRIDEPTVEVDRLCVLGEPCFEITVTRSPFVDFRCIVTTTPRLIAWPPAIDNMTAPQDQRSSMSET